MAPTGPGERAIHLPWFWPDAASFQALANHPDSIPWSLIRSDPGLLIFLFARYLEPADGVPTRLGEEELRAAVAMLSDSTSPWTDWAAPSLIAISRTAAAAAHFAELLAGMVPGVDPARAWTGAWLAYAGWLAIGTTDPQAVADWQALSTTDPDPLAAQTRCWGLTRAEIAWGLAAEWPLPDWAQFVLARFDASPSEAWQNGADRRLQALVQTAVVLAEQTETRLYVAEEFDLSAALAELRLRSSDLDRIRETYADQVDLDNWLDRPWADPRSVPGLAERLNRAADRMSDSAAEEPESVRVDVYAERVQAAKLAAVAEFAAGASHEINNPLAVISGHSQYLLKSEADPGRRDALQSIVRQTRRIHAVLSELMYFARPPVPRPEVVDLIRLAREAVASVAPLAAERNIEVEWSGLPGPVWIKADAKQLSIALSALIRNAVEAALPGGWTRLSVAFRADRLEVTVEDNGPGLDDRSRDHLFDPFYSGRTAGRGRGLGLSAAWRLAKEHGGEVRHEPVPGGPTRFVLDLPAAIVAAAAQRMSA